MAASVRTVEQGAPTSTGLSNAKLGMWAFLASECLLFGALISTFLLFRGRSLVALPIERQITPQKIYDIPFTSVSSFVLLMSSLTMVLALAAIQRGDEGKLRVWLVATASICRPPRTTRPSPRSVSRSCSTGSCTPASW